MRALLLPLALAFMASWGDSSQADAVFPVGEVSKAEALAKDRSLAIAWVCSNSEMLAHKDIRMGNSDQLTQMVMANLHQGDDSCVVIFVNGNNELRLMPDLVYHQMARPDEPGDGRHFYIPKIVFTNEDASAVLGILTFRELNRDGATSLLNMLFHVSRALQRGTDSPGPQTPPPPAPITSDASSTAGDPNLVADSIEVPSSGFTFSMSSLPPQSLYLVIFVVIAVTCASGLLFYQLLHWLRPRNDNPYSHPTQRLPDTSEDVDKQGR